MSATTVVLNFFPKTGQNLVSHSFALLYPTTMLHFEMGSTEVFKNLSSDFEVITSVRNPLDACSVAMYNDYLNNSLGLLDIVHSVDQYIAFYIRFYSYILTNNPDILLIDYNQIVSNYPAVIEKINQKFNLTASGTVTYQELNDALKARALTVQNEKIPDNSAYVSAIDEPSGTEFEAIKTEILSNSKYSDAVTLYNTLVATIQ